MTTSRRCCQSVIRCSTTASGCANGSRRAFSRVAPQQKDALPEYYESSSPELDAVLTKINSKILFPQHLNHEQRLLVYKKKNIPRLTNEPLFAQIGSVDQQLEPLDVRKDVPNQWEMIKQAVELSKEQDDWENLVKMLEGFHRAGIDVKTSRMLKIIRRANEAGMQHIVLSALQQAEHTGVSLRRPAILEAVLGSIHEKASSSGFDSASTKKALSLAEQVIELLELPAHKSKGRMEFGDPRASPLVISVPLELAASRVAFHPDGKDEDGKVATYAARLMAAFKQEGYSEKIHPGLLAKELPNVEEFSKLPKNKAARRERRYVIGHKIVQWIPVWNALKQSSAVLGKDMPDLELAKTIMGMIEERLKGSAEVIRKYSDAPEPEKTPSLVRMKEVDL
ncbi:uncharacterized protein BDZ99DRAFT_405852 [Mytilinidion resinicola]|uniref:Uncharacterized protein n=1 Tax=Mytilinidion resinicola TaxID=574789 RepID=A0A6A6Z5T8_9PEZI|nr:uncharacterized protein BDZ99DRAFT_405852 [Mytilinidion resinicola]KAF2815627.1 hypothetical protein BDZ99DRAFT_405852 [Mytilinidion resinicola]